MTDPVNDLTSKEGKERRQYFRIETAARIAARVVSPEAEASVRTRVLSRQGSKPFTVGASDERATTPEARALFELLERVTFSLDRIERQLHALASTARGEATDLLPSTMPREITLSASGLRSELDCAVDDGQAVELLVDLSEAGVPLIHALARVVRTQKDGERRVVALNFEAITPEDRERIVQLCLRLEQRHGLDEGGDR